MDLLKVPQALRDRLADAGTDALVMMFAEAHQIAVASFEHRLADEASKLRLDMAALKFDLLKWTFLFWIGQLAAIMAMLSWMLEGR